MKQKSFDAANTNAIQQNFNKVQISLANPDKIRSWSYGIVKKPETMNYRTFKPEKDGLFCSRIFGPVKDFECLCGKYKRMKNRGIICEKCGVEVTSNKVRRERIGHIELASPVAHIWFAKSLPSRIGTLLDLNTRNLDRILYFDGYVVLDSGMTELNDGQVLSDEELEKAQHDYGKESFRVGSGAEAIKEMLAGLNLSNLRDNLKEELSGDIPESKRKKIIKRLKLINSFLSSNTKPEWMILDVVPVLPPELRPLVQLDLGRFATADLNDLYRKLINRNNRLKRLLDLNAPEIIIRNEKRMLQESVDSLLDNGRRGRPILGVNKRPLKSLSDLLKGKTGRFRMNLLGKRVDYSARSVIVVGPDLKLHQCGLPEDIAIEIFKPFVYAKLAQYGIASTIKLAKEFVDSKSPQVISILEEVVKERLVLLNRAPTLHKLSIQAFEPKLIKGKAIQIHPLVCSPYNADFDGDQMAVHLPLSIEAQTEARVLMMSTNNILSPANGFPVILPTKDIVLGIYYLTMSSDKKEDKALQNEEKMSFYSLDDAMAAFDAKIIGLHTPIFARVSDKEGTKRTETTLGRLVFWNAFPKSDNLLFSMVNECISSKKIAFLMNEIYRYCGQNQTVEFADKIVQIGFKYATLSGISFGKDDLIVPDEKEIIIDKAKNIVSEYNHQYMEGLITSGEKYNKCTDIWVKCTEDVSKAMMKYMLRDSEKSGRNSVLMMMESGARGSEVQLRQLAGMRGLVTQHDGSIMENPILSNLKEGQSTIEVFISTSGARKGLADTALKTSDAGYFTRRLVDVAQDCVISIHDCGTTEGLIMQTIVEGDEVILSLSDRILGRVSTDDVIDASGNKLCAAGEIIDDNITEKIISSGIELIKCRSVLTCESDRGICALCYGMDLSRKKLVNIGEAVGIIAAQSIGEPGTQLTLRTFHSGGAAHHSSETSFIEASTPGTIKLKNKKVLHGANGQTIVMSRHMEIIIQDQQGKDIAMYKLPYGANIFVNEEDKIEKGTKLAEWDQYNVPIIAECDGIINYVDLIDGLSMREFINDSDASTKRVVINWQKSYKGKSLQPKIVIRNAEGDQLKTPGGADAKYLLSQDTTILFDNKANVRIGDVIAKISKGNVKSKDMVGGLPRITDLFEARLPKDPAIISECDGHVQYGKDYKTRRRIFIMPEDLNKKPIEYVIPKGKQFLIQEGEFVKKGDVLVDGDLVPHDILRILGKEALASYLIKEIQDVYRMQGVRTNDKHIEIIIRQMLRKFEVVDPGDTLLLTGDHVDNYDLEEANSQIEDYKLPASVKPVLQGITTSSLHTRSFISAASFQETTKVLIHAAVAGKTDDMLGLKENIITGGLIPAGTGFIERMFRIQAEIQDEVLYTKYNKQQQK